ncbi:uncharacterized protein PV07_10519 [Cladophialophora immunda]|uniref:PNPLA domain-containing protein n=1 Tax=Cladophialophora immunda TaxID=569365 RepID=A0A0D2CMN4_9EURO|nr:uncharacterized protein PV07_10519 [Cladophialophora immunda]KIW24829.1 hypothetical protein PV07_10519 [Cladophialophora immunda]
MPPTVEPNIAAIDGGGVRGLVALVLLKRLQAALDTGHHIREYFDYFIGTSAGGLIVLDHVVCQSSLDSSIKRFEALSNRIFPKRAYGFMPIFQRLIHWLVWWVSDNKYDSGTLEDVVQEAFGVRQRLFDFASQHQSGIKVAVTASTVSSSQLRLFTNYNGVARDRQGKGYAILRPPDPSGEPHLWEIARCAAAAPSYFRPKVIKHFGALQDGGITDNNPTEKALWELGCIWPDPLDHDSELYRGIWLDGFVPRILRAFLSSPSLDADNSWAALSNRLHDDVRERFHRLTLEFADELPELDDTSQIPRLIQIATHSPLDLDEEKRKLWASRFFFELHSKPERVCDYYKMWVFQKGSGVRSPAAGPPGSHDFGAWTRQA